MSSVDNILGLVSHLHSMESSFSAILIEAAMKLASLTDANLFILVETKDGRRFAGKRHLCNMYTSGQLAPAGSDLEMEVDPSVIGLRARYVGVDRQDADRHSTPPTSVPSTTHLNATSPPPTSTMKPSPLTKTTTAAASHLLPSATHEAAMISSSSSFSSYPSPSLQQIAGGSSASTSPRIGLKRSCDVPSTGASEERRKRFASDQETKHRDLVKCEVVDLHLDTRDAEASVGTSRTDDDDDSMSDEVEEDSFTRTISLPRPSLRTGETNLKCETSSSSASSASLPAMASSGSQTEFFVDQSYIEPFAGHFLESEDEFKTMLQNQSGSQFEGSSLQLPLTCMETSPSMEEEGHDSAEEQQSQQQQQQNLGNRIQFDVGGENEDRKPYDPDQVFGWNSTEFLSLSVRASNILSINDSSIADKSSANHRLFMSLIHEYTKESTKYVPEGKLARKDFVDKIFANFWLYFPHLDTLHNLGAKISIGKRYYFLKAFVRAGIARGLSSILGRRSSYSQETLDNIEKRLTEMRRN